MDKQHYDQLVKGVTEMKRHMAGKVGHGAITTDLAMEDQTTPDVRIIREAAHISQSPFAKLIGVNLRTLQNGEQQRTRPTGPASALLKIVSMNPRAIEALHV
jgi:putative transcriptional regulator